MQLHAHLQVYLQVAAWIQVMKYSFCVATSMETKPWRTLQYVLYVRGSLSFSSFSFSASFFPAKPVLLTAFLQPSAPSISLSASFLYPSLFSSPSFSLGSLVCQACNRAAIVWSGKQQELYPVNPALSVCVFVYVFGVYFRKVHVIVCGYGYNVWWPAVCMCVSDKSIHFSPVTMQTFSLKCKWAWH